MKSRWYKFILVSISILATVGQLSAQKGTEDGSRYGHGADSIKCVRNLTLYRESIKVRDYDRALPLWKIPFDECPQSSKNVYLDGVKLYRNILDNAKDELSLKNGLDTLMLIYERRIQYFKQTGNVKGRQGVDLLRYGRNDINNIEKAYNLLKESISIEKDASSAATVGSYFSASIVLFQNDVFSPNQVIEDYIMVSDLIDKMIEKKPSTAKKLNDLKASIDENFVNDGPGDCDTLIEFFSEQLDAKKNDVKFLRMLTSLLRNRDCSDSELFYLASKHLHAISPNAESALNIAIMDFNLKKYKSAADYYQQAVNLETDEDKKADYYFGLAACYSELDNKPKSRELALKAANHRPNWGEPYILIGQLYASSRNECGSIKLPGSIYWVAVDKFIKAKTIDPSVEEKANKLILSYSGYFPDKEKAFFEDVTEGNSFSVGCWINETTKARFNN